MPKRKKVYPREFKVGDLVRFREGLRPGPLPGHGDRGWFRWYVFRRG